MSGRELVILLLGLAIVAVVLRGLYVAINARRGQIKLAIDKNIPQNVDLEALEMAELPGGGARVVTRSLEEVNRQNSALDKAEFKAKAMNLADDSDESDIPVLMDAVELAEPAEVEQPPVAQQDDPEWDLPEDIDFSEEGDDPQKSIADDAMAAEEVAEPEEVVEEEFTSYLDSTPSIGDDWEDEADEEELAEPATEITAVTQASEAREDRAEDAASHAEEEDPDSILFDYGEDDSQHDERHEQADSMSSVAPDYDDVEDDEPADEEDVEPSAAFTNEDSYANSDEADEDSLKEDEQGQSFEDDSDYDEVAEQARVEENAELSNSDADIDEFSMTAGERIGGNPARAGEVKQSNLFDEDEGEAAEIERKPKKSRSLFSMFGRKSEQKSKQVEQDDEIVAAQVDDESGLDDYETDESTWAEQVEDVPAAITEQTSIPEIDVVDELDQKRAATVEQEPEVEREQHEDIEQSEVLVLNVTAKDGRVFAGDDLLQILIMSGLKFGDMNIFHKRLSKDSQSSVIFSVANMLNPGTFDLNNMDEFTTLGISFFLALPTAINNLDAFEQMLGVAQDIRDTLDGDLKDDHRNGMTAQTIEHYRQRVRDFELRRLKAVAARG